MSKITAPEGIQKVEAQQFGHETCHHVSIWIHHKLPVEDVQRKMELVLDMLENVVKAGLWL